MAALEEKTPKSSDLGWVGKLARSRSAKAKKEKKTV